MHAHAKLNLILSVGPPNPPEDPHPGWHPICTWMAPIDLADELELTRAEAASTHTIDWAPDALRPTPIDWPIEHDLAVRAHRALESRVGKPLPVRMHLRKRVPVGGGLGGGSSDAAAMLLALRDLYSLGLDDSALAQVGATLGSDVAFFCRGEDEPAQAIVEGLGDRIERLPGVAGRVVLVIPPWSCATPAVYRAFDGVIAEADRRRRIEWEVEAQSREARGEHRGREPLPHRVRADLVRSRMEACGSRVDGTRLFNDLWPAACLVEPRLADLAASLRRVTREDVHLTGSGSCLFIATTKPEKALEQCLRVVAPVEGAAAMVCSLQ